MLNANNINLEGLNEKEKQMALQILEELSKNGSSSTYNDLKYQDYDEIPVDIETFLKDPNYLGRGLVDSEGRFTVFPYWVETLKKIFPTPIETAYNTLILTGGIGLGKSLCATLVILYYLYRVMCLKDANLHFGLQPMDEIWFSMMNVTIEAAQGVAWSKAQELLQSSPWFMARGTVKGTTNLEWVPNNGKLRLVYGSNNNKLIGKCLLVNFTDEVNFSAMTSNVEKIKKKQMRLISQIDARLQSRFMKGSRKPYINIIASSKDTEQAFMESYIELKKKNESKATLIIDEPQWVIRTDKDSKEKFWVAVGNKFQASEVLPKNASEELVSEYRNKGYSMLQVPIGYYENFLDNVELALTDIAGKSTTNALKYISGLRLTEIKTKEYQNPFVKDEIETGTDDEEHQYSEWFDLSRVPSQYKYKPLFIHLDMSKSGDRTGIAGAWIDKKVKNGSQDESKELYFRAAFSVSIKAPKGQEISFEKNRRFIRWLKQQGFKIKGVTSDTYQSAQIQQQLKAEGFEASILSVDRLDNIDGTRQKICLPYQYFRQAIYEKRISLYDKCDLLTREIVDLEKEPDGHINHPENGTQGCFTGETKVRLTDGRSLSFLELVDEYVSGKRNYVYSINLDKQKIEAKPIINAWKTLEDQPLVRITFDNGEFVECTLNHRFMLRNGEYVEAENLLPGDSLMPLYTRTNGRMKNYRTIYNPFEDEWHYEHRQFAEEVLDEKYLVHHKDCNPKNNNPDNLIWCSKEAHQKIHKELSTGAHSEEASQKRKESLSNYYKNNRDNPAFIERNIKISEKLRARLSDEERKALDEKKLKQKENGIQIRQNAQKRRDEHQKYIEEIESIFHVDYSTLSDNEKDSLGVRLFWLKHEDLKVELASKTSDLHQKGVFVNAEKALKAHNEQMSNLKKLFPMIDHDEFERLFGFSYDTLTKSQKGVWSNRYRQKLYELVNHKVVSIEFIARRADVYDIEVADNHNFALDCGVFVHNSKDQVDALCGAIYNASKHAEQFAFDYGETLEQITQFNSDDQDYLSELNNNLEQTLQQVFDPINKKQQQIQQQQNNNQYMDFGFGKAQEIQNQNWLSQGIIVF